MSRCLVTKITTIRGKIQVDNYKKVTRSTTCHLNATSLETYVQGTIVALCVIIMHHLTDKNALLSVRRILYKFSVAAQNEMY